MTLSDRTALLTLSLSTGDFCATFAADDVATAQRDARSLLEAGATVSLKWITKIEIAQTAEAALVTALAAFARDDRFNSDRAISYRVISVDGADPVIWLMIASNDKNGRGYLLGWHRGTENLQVVSGAPTQGLYMWGFARLALATPVEGAVITRDWTAL